MFPTFYQPHSVGRDLRTTDYATIQKNAMEYKRFAQEGFHVVKSTDKHI